MRIALFGSESHITLEVLNTLLAAGHEMTVVMPFKGPRVRLAQLVGRRQRAVENRVREARATLLIDGDDRALAEGLRRFQPQLIVIAIYPRLVPQTFLEAPTLGAVNLHPSLLPRHRGPLPLFWTYYHGDRTTGLTVHYATNRFDAGAILAQDAFALARGYSFERLNHDLAARSGALLVRAISELQSGGARGVPQIEVEATRAPLIKPGTAMVRFDEWDVERVWHFLAGLAPRFREPLIDNRGLVVRYRSVPTFERGHSGKVGSVARHSGHWKLNCRDGTVTLLR